MMLLFFIVWVVCCVLSRLVDIKLLVLLILCGLWLMRWILLVLRWCNFCVSFVVIWLFVFSIVCMLDIFVILCWMMMDIRLILKVSLKLSGYGNDCNVIFVFGVELIFLSVVIVCCCFVGLCFVVWYNWVYWCDLGLCYVWWVLVVGWGGWIVWWMIVLFWFVMWVLCEFV